MIKITVVLENTCLRHNFLATHGQSLLIEYNDKKYLFDVGQTYDALMFNLKQLNVSIDQIDALIISHRHMDHVGALPQFINNLTNQKIYFPPQMGLEEIKDMASKFQFGENKLPGDKYNTSLTKENWENIKANYTNFEIVEEPKEIDSGLYLTGGLGEKMKEQSIIIDLKEKGIVILVGCSHPKLDLIMEESKNITGNNKIMGIIGGFHYKDMSEEEIEKQVDIFRHEDITFIAPGHCTGVKATHILQKELGDKVKISKTGLLGAGNSITIDPELSFDFV